jgi:energy-coupling factor transporter ATP-binding protein EcfA2
MSRQELLDLIDLAAREEWVILDLSKKGITDLPSEIGHLISLQWLDLSYNPLTTLLDIISHLTSLQSLNLSNNRLTTLPSTIGHLTNLQSLNLSNNRFTTLPGTIGHLTNLQSLNLSNNRFTTLPGTIGHLTSLQSLDLSFNQLTSLPTTLAQLQNLHNLSLGGNPLNPAMQSAYRAGLDELRAYLHSLEEAEPLYEAKLVLVGEGGVGKTTLLKALTGQETQEGEETTHGVKINVEAFHLPHPAHEDVFIQFNAWDFGGQEVYRVTHQFFFSPRSVYLLLWRPRYGVEQSRVEEWLKMIRLRVGDAARVIIVASHARSDQRIPRIDRPVLERDFPGMVVGFHEVDSLIDDAATGDKVGVAELKTLIAQTARDLEQMGMGFNRHWREARDELLDIANWSACIPHAEFAAVCQQHGLDDISTRTLAVLMHDLGYIVYYGDDERLQDDVVLQPEWLTKAIGFVLEDRVTQEMDGLLPDTRLREVWHDHPFENEPRYDPVLYPFFLRLMEKYDVSYRLESGTASLVAQHVPQLRPKELPWLPEEEVNPGYKRIALVCTMDEAPPGLVPWMIVRTHDYIYERPGADGKPHRLHWQRGMFLRNRTHGEAMLELRGSEFHIYAEARWPEYFMNVLRRTLHKLITDNWPGLEGRYTFTVPCRAKQNGSTCAGRFDIEALRQFLDEGDDTLRCQVCRTRQNIVELLYGFEEEDERAQLIRIENKMERGFADLSQEVAGLESRISNYVSAIMHAIADEAKRGPRLFSIEPVDGNWLRFINQRYRLHLWCEAEGSQHPVLEAGKGVYEFKATREWVKQVAPYANFVAGVLRTVLPVAAPSVDMFFGPDTIKNLGIKAHLDLMKELTGRLKEDVEILDHPRLRDSMLTGVERSGLLALHAFLREHDPNQARLGLHRQDTYTGNFLWLCDKHYAAIQSKVPDEIV